MAIEIEQNTILRILVRRGSEAEKNSIILAQGEPGYALDTKVLSIGDGTTYGGVPVPKTDNSSITWAGTTPDYIQVADGGVTNTKLAQVAGNSVKANASSATATTGDVAVAANAVLGRMSTLNGGNLTSIPFATIFSSLFSPVAPDPSFLGYWFNTNDYRWYTWNGIGWISQHPDTASGPKRILYVGNGSAITTYDGGSSGTVTLSSGPMWEVDTDYTSKVLRGNASGAAAVVPFPGGGADTVTLTSAMLAAHTHSVTILIPGHGGGDGSRDAADGGTYSAPNASNPNFDWTGKISPLPSGGTAGKYAQDAFGLPAVYQDYGDGKTVSSTPTPVNTLPAYQSILVLKRTARAYYVA